MLHSGRAECSWSRERCRLMTAQTSWCQAAQSLELPSRGFALHFDIEVHGRDGIRIFVSEDLPGLAAVQSPFYFPLRSLVLRVSSGDLQGWLRLRARLRCRISGPTSDPPKSPDRYGLGYTAYLGSECLPCEGCPLPHSVAGKGAPGARGAQGTGAWGLRIAQVKPSLKGCGSLSLPGLLVRVCLPWLFSVRVCVLGSQDTDMLQDVSAHQVLKNGHYKIFMSSLWKL